jgi:hypothetical protein
MTDGNFETAICNIQFNIVNIPSFDCTSSLVCVLNNFDKLNKMSMTKELFFIILNTSLFIIRLQLFPFG